MILRRVVEHAKTQNWFAVTLDFFIVVTGVFLGIEASNWNQARQDRQEERRYYGQLLVDLRGDLEVFARAEKRADLYDAAAELVIDRLGGKAPPKVSPGQMAMAIHKAGWVYIPYASRGTYNELVSTGTCACCVIPSSSPKSQIIMRATTNTASGIRCCVISRATIGRKRPASCHLPSSGPRFAGPSLHYLPVRIVRFGRPPAPTRAYRTC
jgi:hypothetical protein